LLENQAYQSAVEIGSVALKTTYHRLYEFCWIFGKRIWVYFTLSVATLHRSPLQKGKLSKAVAYQEVEEVD